MQDNQRNETLQVLAGDDLYLNAQPKSPPASSSLTLRTAVGPAGAASVVYLTEFGGAPALIPVGGFGVLGPDGTREVAFQVPPGLGGLTARLVGFVAAAGPVQSTAAETISFQ